MLPLRLGRRAVLATPVLLISLGRVLAADSGFTGFLAQVRRDAVAQGIRVGAVDYALRSAQYLPHVIELDRKQPERTMTFAQFIEKVVTPQREADARAALAENRALLEGVRRRFNVQPQFIVALWGIESGFGKVMGNYPVVSALATLAYDGRRSSYFRGELIAALRIIDQGNVHPDAMFGSWAGAMGQCQFMPTTFLSYAVDYDGDGRRDIWNDRADVLGSIANYISHLGWHGEESWGRRVTVPTNFDTRQAGLEIRRPLSEWQRMGLRTADAAPLPTYEIEASLVMPDGSAGPAMLVYDNFRAIMKWNKSTFFAACVGLLADSIERG